MDLGKVTNYLGHAYEAAGTKKAKSASRLSQHPEPMPTRRRRPPPPLSPDLDPSAAHVLSQIRSEARARAKICTHTHTTTTTTGPYMQPLACSPTHPNPLTPRLAASAAPQINFGRASTLTYASTTGQTHTAGQALAAHSALAT